VIGEIAGREVLSRDACPSGHVLKPAAPSLWSRWLPPSAVRASHIHTVWRDFHGDFGEDLLREQYPAYRQMPGISGDGGQLGYSGLTPAPAFTDDWRLTAERRPQCGRMTLLEIDCRMNWKVDGSV
jgi:hypothetical protein